MTGTIRSLDEASASGVITAQDGVAVGFPLSAVLAYDLPVLAVGQTVSFDIEGRRQPKALNVYVQRPPQSVKARSGHPEETHLRYVGFEHRGSVRAYLFDGLTPGAERRRFAVDADLGLFAKHHVGVQEGPSMCLRLLAAELDISDAAVWTSLQCSLTDRDMLAHLASRPVRRGKYGAKRAPPASGHDSDVG